MYQVITMYTYKKEQKVVLETTSREEAIDKAFKLDKENRYKNFCVVGINESSITKERSYIYEYQFYGYDLDPRDKYPRSIEILTKQGLAKLQNMCEQERRMIKGMSIEWA